jgi:hypothetical protein
MLPIRYSSVFCYLAKAKLSFTRLANRHYGNRPWASAGESRYGFLPLFNTGEIERLMPVDNKSDANTSINKSDRL